MSQQSVSDKWLVGSDDIRMLTRAWEERLETTENPRHRAILETAIRHQYTEGTGDLDGVMATLSPDPLFIHYEGIRRAGRDAVRDYYASVFDRGGLGNVQVENVRLVVDDDTIVTQARVSRMAPSRLAGELGYAVPDDDGHYLLHHHVVVVLPFDDEARMCGEISYSRKLDPLDWDRVPDDELSPGFRAWLASLPQ